MNVSLLHEETKLSSIMLCEIYIYFIFLFAKKRDDDVKTRLRAKQIFFPSFMLYLKMKIKILFFYNMYICGVFANPS